MYIYTKIGDLQYGSNHLYNSLCISLYSLGCAPNLSTKQFINSMCCNVIYIGCTPQCLEFRVKQHVPRDICNHTTSGHSKLFDSTICEYLNTINICVVNYSDECFVVLQRARPKQHLIVLEAIYILFNRSSLYKQTLTLS